MRILLTGAAGFIGMHLTRKLLNENHEVVGIDNLTPYYEPALKYARLNELGIDTSKISIWEDTFSCKKHFAFRKVDICDSKRLRELFTTNQFDAVIHLAAQAGVQYSRENPDSYIQTNINGFYQILEACNRYHISDLYFASSSSVYGYNNKMPYSVTDSTDNPASLYAATKKSNELMAHAYTHINGMRITGFRFFTVYGPWGRPDMAPYLFTDAILHDRPIRLYNRGAMWRDFTYIDDITEGIMLILRKKPDSTESLYRIYNIGNSHPSSLTDLVSIIEQITGKKSSRIYMPIPPGDVLHTYADISPLQEQYGYEPRIGLEEGMSRFIKWYQEYNGCKQS